jgi:hypothetical protein
MKPGGLDKLLSIGVCEDMIRRRTLDLNTVANTCSNQYPGQLITSLVRHRQLEEDWFSPPWIHFKFLIYFVSFTKGAWVVGCFLSERGVHLLHRRFRTRGRGNRKD